MEPRAFFPWPRSSSAVAALVWLSGGSGFPRWCPVEMPRGCVASSSFTSGRSKNPPWKLRSKSSQRAKVKGFSASSPLSRVRHPSSIAARAAGGLWAGLQKIWGARTWNPQKCRIPFWKKQEQAEGRKMIPQAFIFGFVMCYLCSFPSALLYQL